MKEVTLWNSVVTGLVSKHMDLVLQGISEFICYLDDILISSKDEMSHLKTLEEVLTWLEKRGFHMKESKCQFFKSFVEYLRHKISQSGIQALQSQVDAIANAPTPTNIQEVCSFLGLLNYYGKFVHNLSTMVQPLHALFQAGKSWSWTIIWPNKN